MVSTVVKLVSRLTDEHRIESVMRFHHCLGHPCEFLIDTVNAGAGALAVTVDGPSKVQLDCKEVAEGTQLIDLS